MDYHILENVVNELSDVLPKGRLDKVFEGPDRRLYLVLHGNRKDRILLLSPDRSMPRMHLVSKKPKASESPSGFVQYLRSRLTGSRLTEISLLNHDRVAELLFAKTGKESRLIFELTGSGANIMLADGSGKVLSVYYPVRLSDNVKRPMLSGSVYSPPEKRGERPGKASTSFYTHSGAECPANRGAESYYEKIIQDRFVKTLRAGLHSVVKKAVSKTCRRIEALSGDTESAKKADEYRQAGDLIIANIWLIKNGAELEELVGHDGRAAFIRLDPRLTPARNAEAYYRKYKKAKAGLRIISERLEQARREESYLSSILSEVDKAADGESLLLLRAELEGKGYVQPDRGRDRKAKNKPSEAGFRRIVYNGWEIFIGKSASGNDYITTRLARPDDLWLHAEGLPGSHVLLRNPNRAEPPPDVLMKAASLAAFYSKGRGAGKTPVAYTSARFVKKPKGARPGAVILSRRKTVMAAPEV